MNSPSQFRLEFGGSRSAIPPLIGCLSLLAILMLMCLVPLLLFDVSRSVLEKMGLSPWVAGLSVLGIFLGSIINIPVWEIRKDELQPEVAPGGPLGMMFQRTYRRVQSRTVIAVNVGGCVIPVLIAAGQLWRLADDGPRILLAAGLVSLASIVVCWWVARPVEGIGIMLPGFVPPLVSVAGAWLLLGQAAPDQRAAAAFLAGVSGPLIGADLLRLRDVLKVPVGVMSIGGAGTFDGIVLSGILATLLA